MNLVLYLSITDHSVKATCLCKQEPLIDSWRSTPSCPTSFSPWSSSSSPLTTWRRFSLSAGWQLALCCIKIDSEYYYCLYCAAQGVGERWGSRLAFGPRSSWSSSWTIGQRWTSGTSRAAPLAQLETWSRFSSSEGSHLSSSLLWISSQTLTGSSTSTFSKSSSRAPRLLSAWAWLRIPGFSTEMAQKPGHYSWRKRWPGLRKWTLAMMAIP